MRNRQFRRNVRYKAINRKYRIREFLWGKHEVQEYYNENPIGELSKGKIHCSCPLCRTKSYDRLSKRDKSILSKMDYDFNNIEF